MTSEINFLLCSPSPRDLPEVYSALKKCPYDRLYAKYFPEVQAYTLLRNYFLSHAEYTHLVICPDDLIIEKKNVENLRDILEKQPYDVLAGVCNVDLGENRGKLNVTHNLPHPTRWVPERGQTGWRTYDWFREDEVTEGIFPVKFSGFACQAISREIVERLPFQDDSAFNGTPGMTTGAIDVMFANQCFSQKPFILQMVDFGNRMRHLKLAMRFQDISLGDGELRLYPRHKDMFEMIFQEPLGKKTVWRMNKESKVIEGMVKSEK